jgi:hypothetical protein
LRVFPSTRESLRELVCLVLSRVCPCLSIASTSLLYLKGDAYMAVGSPTGGPNRGSIKYHTVHTLWRYRRRRSHSWISLPARRNLLTSIPMRCLVETAPGVACGVDCSVAEWQRSLRRRRHDGKVLCRHIQLMRQTGSVRMRHRRLQCVPR